MPTEKWVANHGTDSPSTPGTEPLPYKTIQYGVDILKGLGGGVLHVKVGFYNENVVMRGVAYSNIKVQGWAPPSSIEAPPNSSPCDAKPTVDGGTLTTNHRVFEVGDCTGVILENLTIQNGSEIHMGSDLDGGGVLAENAQVDILGCCIRNNHAGHGGGFAYLNCKTGRPSRIQACMVFDNDAARDGGGGCILDSADITISQTSFKTNSTKDGLGGGGLCLRRASKITIEDHCLFEENEAGKNNKPVNACNGGGLYLEECGDAPPTIRIRDHNKFQKNKTKGRGGAIHMLNRSYAEITDNEILENTAEGSGGGISCVQVTQFLSGGSNVTLEKAAGRFVLIQDNIIRGNGSTDGGGGGLYASATSYVVLQGNTIENNKCKHNGGGMQVSYNSFLEATGHNIFRKNEAQNHGGGLSARNSHVTLLDENQFIENQAPHAGGGVYINTEKERTAPGGLISYHSYMVASGFTIANVRIEHLNRFEKNRSLNGAGLCCEAARSVIPMSVIIRHGNVFTDNETSNGGAGGGFSLEFLDELIVDERNKIEGNKAPGFMGISGGAGGGGLILHCINPMVTTNEVQSNQADNGPGLKLRHCVGFRIAGNKFAANTENPQGGVPGRLINLYFNACQMGAQTPATIASANPPLLASEVLVYP